MTKPETSPFTPGRPVPADLFVGREAPLDALRGRARAAAGGRLEVGFLSGERGIGKTSLARFAARACEDEHGLLPVHVILGAPAGTEEVVRQTFDRIAMIARTERWPKRFLELFGERIRQVGTFGFQVEFAPKAKDLASMTRNFDIALRGVMDAFPDSRRGLFLTLDDINGLAATPPFAFWLKRFVDTVAVSEGPFPVYLLLIGTERVRRQLASHHESVARIFDLVHIEPWSNAEVAGFFRRTLDRVGMKPDGAALELMCHFAGGLPVLAHEIGDTAFRVAREAVISERDARNAVVAAAQVVGTKYVAVQVFDWIRSGRYRSLLRKIPQMAAGGTFRRKEVLKRLRPEEGGVLDTFLQEMLRLEVLERVPDAGPGRYRFAVNLHYLDFLAEAVREGGSRRRRLR